MEGTSSRLYSTGAVGGRDEHPVDSSRGADLAGVGTIGTPFPAVLAVEAGFWLPDGTAPGSLATDLGHPWTSLETPVWAGGRLKDGTAVSFFPLILFFLLSPYISVTEPQLQLRETQNSVSWPKVTNIARKVGWVGWVGERATMQASSLMVWSQRVTL